jgi:hypothetical protein
MIEKGRHFKNKIPLENRLCTLCNVNEVEDETHFMIRCSYYSDLRHKMFSDITDAYINFNDLSDYDKFQFLMSVNEYDCVLPVLQYINSAFEKRKTFDI